MHTPITVTAARLLRALEHPDAPPSRRELRAHEGRPLAGHDEPRHGRDEREAEDRDEKTGSVHGAPRRARGREGRRLGSRGGPRYHVTSRAEEAHSMNVRRATLSDLPTLMLLQGRCHTPDLHDSEADAAHDIATNEYLVACDGERVIGAAIGCCAPSGDWFHVYSVETDPQYQRRGVGHRLMVALLARAPAGATLSADAATLGGAALLRKFPQIEVRNAAPDASFK